MDPKPNEYFILEAIKLAIENVEKNAGGPFAALVVRDGEIIGRGINSVTQNNDPTAHAEVMAIRDACKNVGHFWLEGSVIYSSCEPCPMCLSAIYWAHISKIYYAATVQDAQRAGFDDSEIKREICSIAPHRSIQSIKISCPKTKAPFEAWNSKVDKITF